MFYSVAIVQLFMVDRYPLMFDKCIEDMYTAWRIAIRSI